MNSKIIAAVAVAACLATAAGCGRRQDRQDKPGGAVEVVQLGSGTVAADAPVAVKSARTWEKSEVNGLLRYVPADAPFVLVSTRNVGAEHPAVAKVLSKYGAAWDSIERLTQSAMVMAPEGVVDDEAFAQLLLKFFGPLMKDVKRVAPEYGVDMEHSDSVVYYRDGFVVAKQTLLDGKVFAGKINEFLEQAPGDLKTLLNVHSAGVAGEWTMMSIYLGDADLSGKAEDIVDDEFEKYESGKFAEILRQVKSEPEKYGVPAGEVGNYSDEDFSELAYEELERQLKADAEYQSRRAVRMAEVMAELENHDEGTMNLSVALNYDDDMLTAVVTTKKIDPSILGKFKVDVEKPLQVAALGEIGAGDAAVGYVDNVAIARQVMGDKSWSRAFADLLQTTFQKECATEIPEFIAGYPKIHLKASVVGDSTFSSSATLEIADGGELSRLRSLHSPAPAMPYKLMGFGMNVDLKRLVDMFIEAGTGSGGKSYGCKLLRELDGVKKNVAEMLTNPSDAPAISMLSGVSGVGVSVDEIDFEKEDVKGVASLYGNGIAPLVQLGGVFLASKIADISKLHTGMSEPVKIDLKPLDIDAAVNAYMTNDALVVSSDGYDIKPMASASRTIGDRFVSVSLSSDLYRLISSNVDLDDFDDTPEQQEAARAFKESLDALYDSLKMRMTFAIGTDGRGIAVSSDIEL